MAYEKAINQIIPVTSSPEMALKMAQKFYPAGQDEGPDKSPLLAANTALTRIRTLLLPVKTNQLDNVFLAAYFRPP